MTESSTPQADTTSIFDDEQWLAIERRRYPRSKEDMAEIIDKEFKEAGEYGEFSIDFYYENEKGDCFGISIWQKGEKYGVEIDDKEIDVSDYNGKEIVEAIDCFVRSSS